jgi:protein with PEP-CTERM/exosortase system signal
MTTKKHAFYGILALVSLLGLGITQSARANLIINGDFETGNFNGWTVIPAPSGSFITVGTTVNGEGPDHTQVAIFGAVGTDFDRISQTFATTPGAFYTLTFFYQVGFTSQQAFNGFDVLWNDVSIGGGLFPQFDVNPGFISPTFILQATSASTTLEFDGRNRPWFDYLDDVSVVGVPDAGSTLSLLSFALLGVAVLRRKLGC